MERDLEGQALQKQRPSDLVGGYSLGCQIGTQSHSLSSKLALSERLSQNVDSKHGYSWYQA